MSILATNPALVVPGPRANIMRGISGDVIAAGQPVFKDTDNKMKLAGAKLPAPGFRVAGIAACSATPGQPMFYNHDDPDLVIGAPVAVGQTLALGDTPGSIVDVADVDSGAVVVVLGVGKAGNLLALNPTTSGTPKP
jgi:hypothetical protein